MHTTPGSIVVGVDGSESSSRALKWAVEQAAAEHRPLTLVHTINAVTPAFIDAAIVDAKNAQSVLEAAGQAELDHARTLVDRASPGLDIHQVFDLVDPREGLLQLSKDAAMIVVGSRGRGPLRSLLLGSVSVALVRHAHCPLVVIRPEHVGDVRHGIMVGLDTTQDSQPVLEFAFRQASLRGLPLTIQHSRWDIQAGTMGAQVVTDEMTDTERERLGLSEAMAGMTEKYPDVQVTSRLSQGRPEQVLTNASEKMDLVVVGAHHRGRFHRALSGSVSTAVVEHARRAVAVIPLSTV